MTANIKWSIEYKVSSVILVAVCRQETHQMLSLPIKTYLGLESNLFRKLIGIVLKRKPRPDVSRCKMQ